ncbi:MAG: peptidase [Alphaproteobacteria bacterium]|nr:peptidase [Alphaproteobacteria bacterium]
MQGFVFAGTTGFQSPADDYAEDRIDLAAELVTTKANTFCRRVVGTSWQPMGVSDGDIAVFDYSKTPKVGSMVLARVGGLDMMKIVRRIDGKLFLTAPDQQVKALPVDEEQGVQILGVLTAVVKRFD